MEPPPGGEHFTHANIWRPRVRAGPAATQKMDDEAEQQPAAPAFDLHGELLRACTALLSRLPEEAEAALQLYGAGAGEAFCADPEAERALRAAAAARAEAHFAAGTAAQLRRLPRADLEHMAELMGAERGAAGAAARRELRARDAMAAACRLALAASADAPEGWIHDGDPPACGGQRPPVSRSVYGALARASRGAPPPWRELEERCLPDDPDLAERPDARAALRGAWAELTLRWLERTETRERICSTPYGAWGAWTLAVARRAYPDLPGDGEGGEGGGARERLRALLRDPARWAYGVGLGFERVEQLSYSNEGSPHHLPSACREFAWAAEPEAFGEAPDAAAARVEASLGRLCGAVAAFGCTDAGRFEGRDGGIGAAVGALVAALAVRARHARSSDPYRDWEWEAGRNEPHFRGGAAALARAAARAWAMCARVWDAVDARLCEHLEAVTHFPLQVPDAHADALVDMAKAGHGVSARLQALVAARVPALNSATGRYRSRSRALR